MKKRAISDFENGFLLLVFLLIIQQLIIYIKVGVGNPLTMEMYVLSFTGLLSIVFGYFIGFRAAIGYSLVFIGGFLTYLLLGRYDVEMFHYIWMLVVAFCSISSAFLNSTRNQIYENEEYMQMIEEDAMYVDPTTKLMTDNAMYDTVAKHTALAYRYDSYSFCIMMIRIEFIETIRLNLGTQEFQSLLNEISKTVRASLRIEDYKFLINGERFIIIFPMTPVGNLQVIKNRINKQIREIKVYDKNERLLEIILKAGIMEYNKINHETFSDIKKLLLALERRTEEDIHAEYKA